MPFVQDILFLDIETVPAYPSYMEVPEGWKALWNKKADNIIRDKEKENAETIYNKAGIYAEFGKIICISCGIINGSGDEKKLTLKSFYGEDEKILLQEFCDMLNKWFGPGRVLCAHNGKEFDFPFIIRRLIINGLPIPVLLQITGKKPWEIPHIDTLEMWKFGDYKALPHLTS